jgi:hypothetical protein
MLSRVVRRGRVATTSKDAGVTLTELIVAMTLSVILGAVTLMLFITVNNSASATTDRTIGATQARSTLQAWTSYLRVSDGTTAGSPSHRFEWITASDMLFHADLGNRSGTTAASTPRLVWLRLDARSKQLIEEQFTSYSSFPASYSSCRFLSNYTSSLTFTGYTSAATSDFGTNVGGSGSGCIPLAGIGTAGGNTTLTAITSVRIDFTVTAADGTRPQEYASLATVPALVGP